ncbi:MAG: hypothetical protein ACHQYP_09545 [Nitrospiria bacterium]
MNVWLDLLGAVVPVYYDVNPTFKATNFGRFYGVLGSIFIVMALLWGWQIDGIAPGRFDFMGRASSVCLASS